MPVVKVKELIGISPKSFDEAFKEVIKQASSQKQGVTGAKILGQSVTIKNGQIVEYKVNVHVAYLWEKKLNK